MRISRPRLRAAAMAVCRAQGFNYEGKDILQSINPRGQQMVRIAEIVIKAIDAYDRANHPASTDQSIEGEKL